MKYVQLGNNGPNVSRFGFGTRKIENLYQKDPDSVISLINTAYDHGINFFIAASHYSEGLSEKALGYALSGIRDEVVIATSAGVYPSEEGHRIDLSAESIKQQLHSSLENLQTDYIDLFQLHYADPFCNVQKTMKFLREQQDADIIKHIGISNFSLRDLDIWQDLEICSLQMPYSPLQREIENQYFKLCKDQGISILAYTPLGGGLFTEISLKPSFKSPFTYFFSPDEQRRLIELIQKLKVVSQELGCSIAHTVLAWVAGKRNISSILIGTNRKDHLLANIEAIETDLNGSEKKMVEEIMEEIKNSFPNGVTIPVKVEKIRHFKGQNYAKVYGSYFRIPLEVKEGEKIFINDTTGEIVKNMR